jgi:exosortase family protein XrtF
MSEKTSLFTSPVALFALRAVGIFVLWYAVYDLWLLPDGRLDEWVSLHIVGLNATLLTAMGYSVWVVERIIGLDGMNGIWLVDGCNGLEVFGLFIGFVVAYPGTWRNRAWFIPAGIFLIYVVNVVRIAVLVVTQQEWPAFFDLMHDYLTTSVFYLVVFVLWVLWAQLTDEKIGGGKDAGNRVQTATQGDGGTSAESTGSTGDAATSDGNSRI